MIGGVFRALLIGGSLLVLAVLLVGLPVANPFALLGGDRLGLLLFASLGVVVGIYAESWDSSRPSSTTS